MPDPTPPVGRRRPGARRARHAATAPGHRRTGVLWPLTALAVLAAVAARRLSGPRLPGDDTLAAPAAVLLRGDGDLALLSPEGLGALHTAVYATVTRAFARHDTLVGAERELLAVALLGTGVLLWRTGRRLGLGDAGCALAVLALAAVPALAPLSAAASPSWLALPWLLLAAWLLLSGRPSRASAVTAAVATSLGVLLAPDALVLLVPGVAAGVAARAAWRRPARMPPGVTRALTVAGIAVGAGVTRLLVGAWYPQPGDPTRWGAGTAELVLVGSGLLVVGVLAVVWLPRLRGPGAALLAGTLLGVVPPGDRLPTLLVCLPLAALLAAVLADALVDRVAAARPAFGRVAREAAAGALVLVLAAALAGVVTGPRGDLGAEAYGQLVAWSDQQLPDDAVLAADPRPAAELVHAGLDLDRLVTARGPVTAATGELPLQLQVSADGDPAADARPVARFPAGSPTDGGAPDDGAPDDRAPDGVTLTVADPDPAEPTSEQLAARRELGEALLANPATTAPPAAAELLRAGSVDPRLLTTLAGLAARFGVSLADLPAVPGELPGVPVRQAVLGSVAGVPLPGDSPAADRLRNWLEAQRSPYRPARVTSVEDGLLLTWPRAPDPDAQVTPGGGG
ncbi:hypothetical protein [Modestobacter roseus]|uniref:hypothetical protein n=1 Tax=Modestobacter roseus TaxID=1181884 RepID=UPI0034DEB57D